ncbi:21168_t:CDS:2, partial [Entrophospora sp. SA101]
CEHLAGGWMMIIMDSNFPPLKEIRGFVCAGEEGNVKYPFNINITSIRRPSDVKGGELITK